jgi:Na+-driven multidrug efflux pump
VERGCSANHAVVKRITWWFVAGAGVYWLAILLAKHEIFRILYSGKYAQVGYLMPVVALGSVFWSARLGPTSGLRAMESPASVFVAVSVSAGISIAFGIPACKLYGLQGAVCAMALSEVLAFVVTIILYRRKIAHASLSVPLAMSKLASADSAGD